MSKDCVNTAKRLFNSVARSKQNKHANLKTENENPALLRLLALLSEKEADQTEGQVVIRNHQEMK